MADSQNLPPSREPRIAPLAGGLSPSPRTELRRVETVGRVAGVLPDPQECQGQSVDPGTSGSSP